jgi:hypothetical protein|tara:strand:+ start:182 stop:598 length:417 start_codon:yes stop_codon:yes gene_type:complete
MSDVSLSRESIRASVLGLEEILKQQPDQYSGKVLHHYAPSLYGREIFMAKGDLVVGKLHKHAHLNSLLEGSCTVVTEDGKELLTAPLVWVSEPHIKRAVYCHTDVRWVTYHPTEETDLTKIEAEVIAPDYQTLLGEEI